MTNEFTHDVGWATELLKVGGRVARKGWNGKGMYLFNILPYNRVQGADGSNHELAFNEFTVIHTVDGKDVPFCFGHMDILANDWGCGDEWTKEMFSSFDVDFEKVRYMHTFGWAVRKMIHEDCIYREGWNGKPQFLFTYGNQERTRKGLLWKRFIVNSTADGQYVPWLCSQADSMSEDWLITLREKTNELIL